MMVMTTTMLKMMTMMMITDIEDGGFQSCAALKISRDQLQYQHEHIIVVITIIINKMASIIVIIIGGNFEQSVQNLWLARASSRRMNSYLRFKF